MRWSASSLKRWCAHPNVLGKDRKVTPETQVAMDRGTLFHSAVERWLRSGLAPELEDLEIQGWLEALIAQFPWPAWAKAEIAWGLTPDGKHAMTSEPAPHKYESLDGLPLLTAGRADLVYCHHENPRGRVIYILDWKTGRWATEPAATNLQVHAAGLALAQRFGATSYVPGIYYTRDAAFDWGDEIVTGSDAAAGVMEEVRASALLDGTPQLGPACAPCWSKKQCSAYQASLTSKPIL